MADRPRACFGIYELDLDTGELRREGLLVRLQAQPAKLLTILVEHAGDVVTRETLRTALWGGDTFVDFDKGLNFAIGQIRTALGDTPDSPRFVRTIPKRGYQFIAPLGRQPTSESAVAVSTDVRSGRRLGTRAVALAAATAVFLAAAVWAVQTRASARRAHTIAVLLFDNETGASDMDLFTQTLTDSVVAQLTSSSHGRFDVIGNAAVLRRPRGQRDLRAIGESLQAGYIVMGQVQRSGEQIRILAHLIRLPEQKHLWVTRLDRLSGDPLVIESDAAERIAADFLGRL